MKNIITQIIIAVAVVFCGSGCVSQIWSEKEFSVALNDNANFEKGLVGWMVQEGEVDVVSGIEGPMPGEKSLRLRTSENGRVRLESVQDFSFKAGESYLIGASVQGFNPVWQNSSGIRGEEGEIRIGPVPISKVRGGYSFWSEDLIVKWPRISGTFQVDQDFEGPLWIEVRASNRSRSLNFLLDNFFISSLTGRLPQPVLSGKPIDLSEGLLAYYPFNGDAKDASGELIRSIRASTSWVMRLVWSSDSKTLASGSGDDTLKMWDPANGQLLQSFKAGAAVRDVTWSPDGKRLASCGSYKLPQIWDTATGEMIWRLRPLVYRTNVGIVFSPDGKKLAVGGDDKLIRIWELPD